MCVCPQRCNLYLQSPFTPWPTGFKINTDCSHHVNIVHLHNEFFVTSFCFDDSVDNNNNNNNNNKKKKKKKKKKEMEKEKKRQKCFPPFFLKFVVDLV